MNERASEPPISFSALLLAGGESRRMGRDKATVAFHGQPMWERQIQTLRDLGPQTILVSRRNRPGWLPEGAQLVLDEPPSRGPLSGIAKALTVIETSHLIVLAVDMPFMNAHELTCLIKLVTEGRGVVPIIGDRAEPLAAIYPVGAASDVQIALAGSDFSLQAVVRELATSRKIKLWPIAKERAQFYRSVNEPEELKL